MVRSGEYIIMKDFNGMCSMLQSKINKNMAQGAPRPSPTAPHRNNFIATEPILKSLLQTKFKTEKFN